MSSGRSFTSLPATRSTSRRGVVTPSNPLLRDVVARAADQTPARLIVVVDHGVARAPSDLARPDRRVRPPPPHVLQPGGARPGRARAAKRSRTTRDTWTTSSAPSTTPACAATRTSSRSAAARCSTSSATPRRRRTAASGSIRIPTTVLAQDDSAVGVKNGINAFGKKNYLGTFAPPFAVINDFAFLPTLSDRDWRGGRRGSGQGGAHQGPRRSSTTSRSTPRRSEARDLAAMEHVIRRSAALHLAHIATGGDPFELGSSRPLDFGHWAAHKLEQLTDHRLRPRRGRGDRDRARHDLRVPVGLPARKPTGGGSSSAAGARLGGLRAGARPAPRTTADAPGVRAARAGGVPRAPGWRADDHAARGHRPAVRRARDSAGCYDPEHRRCCRDFEARPAPSWRARRAS